MDVCMERKTLLKLEIWDFNINEKNYLHFINPVFDDSQQITIIVIFRVTESYWVETIISGKKKIGTFYKACFCVKLLYSADIVVQVHLVPL